MIPKILLGVVLLLLGQCYNLHAQCASCNSTTQYDLKEIGICHENENFHYSRSASLFKDITFQTWSFPSSSDPDNIFYIDFGDGTGYKESNGGKIFQVNYGSAGQKVIKIKKGPNGKVIDEYTLLIKSPKHSYESPDVVWKVETAQPFDPQSANVGATAAAFPANGTTFMTPTKGIGHAYIKYGNPQKKLKNPIIFLDGIDFNTDAKNYFDPALGTGKTDANIIRHGTTGWDIFSMGAEDGWDKATPNAEEDFRMYPEAFQNLRDKGYDIIFLDFAEGATWIQKNAQVLKKLLLMVNEEKAINGSQSENVIVGPSMGGQVARIALAEMERDAQNHCTRLFISFDSPHQGAHIPIGIQSMAWAAFDAGLDCDNWPKLNKPAARQLLIYNLANEVSKGNMAIEKTKIESPINTAAFPILVKPSREDNIPVSLAADGGTIRANYMSYLTQLGYPKLCNNLAISDGNINGKGMNISPSEKVFDGNIHITNTTSILTSIFENILKTPLVGLLAPKFSISPKAVDELNIGAEVALLQLLNISPVISTYDDLNNLVPNSKKRMMDLKMYALPGTNSPAGTFNLHAGCNPFTQGDFLHLNYKPNNHSNVLFEFSVPHGDIPCEYFTYTTRVKPEALPSLLHLDNVPAGGRKDLISIEDLINERGDVKLRKLQATVGVVSGTKQREAQSFIPTFSALDIQIPITNNNLTEPIKPKIDANPLLCPFEQHYGPQKNTAVNLNHVEVDDDMRLQVLKWLDQYSEDLLTVGQLPSGRGISYNYGLWRKRIPSVAINAGGILSVNNAGKTAFLDEDATTKPIFETWVTGCGGATVTINLNGKFNIGSSIDTKSGIVNVPQNSRINVSGGIMSLRNASKLVLQKNAPNINVYIASGTIEAFNTAQIEIQKDGSLRNDNGNINLYHDARVIIQNGGKLDMTGGAFTLRNNSQVTIQKGGKMDVLGGQLTLNDQSQVIVQQGAILTISAQGYALLSNTGKLIVEKGGIVQVLGSGRMHINVDAIADIQGQVVFRDNSECIIQHQGKMDISGVSSFESGTLAMKDNGSITTKKGTYFTVNSALELHAAMNITMNNQSSIHIASYATIKFLGKDDEVVIKGGADEAENTPIVLEDYSNWFVESAMWVRGSSYFKIFGKPTIESPVKKFKLRGDGKRISSNFKLVELMEDATLSLPSEIDFSDGKVIYHNGIDDDNYTSIELLTFDGRNNTFSNVYFKALDPQSSYTVGMQNVESGQYIYKLKVTNCLFDGLDKCMWLTNDYSLGNIEVVGSTMKNFKAVAIHTNWIQNFQVRNCNIISSQKVPYPASSDENAYVPYRSVYAPAIHFVGNNAGNTLNAPTKLIIDNSIIKNEVDWQLYPEWVNTQFSPDENYAESTTGIQNDEMIANEESYLVGLFGGELIVSKGTEIYNGYYGVLALRNPYRDPVGPLVTISGCSKLRDNYAGFVSYNEGNPIPTFTTLILEKGEIIDNTWGIYGTNIIVDANLLELRATNTFSIKGGLRKGHYMCITYNTSVGPSGVTNPVNANMIAPMNYWVNGMPEKGQNYLLSGTYVIEPIPLAYKSQDCFPDEIISFPDDEALIDDITLQQRATITVDNVQKTLFPIYWTGLTQYLKGEYDAAYETMSEISAIPLEYIQASQNPYVHYYRSIAWAIAPQITHATIGKIIANPKATNAVTLYPNPASESFTIQVANGAGYDVVISDMFGKTIKTMNISGTQTIGTNEIAAGMYQVTLKNQTDNTITTQKIVINK